MFVVVVVVVCALGACFVLFLRRLSLPPRSSQSRLSQSPSSYIHTTAPRRAPVARVEQREHVREHRRVLAARRGDGDALAGGEQAVAHNRLVHLVLERRVEALAADLRERGGGGRSRVVGSVERRGLSSRERRRTQKCSAAQRSGAAPSAASASPATNVPTPSRPLSPAPASWDV